MFLVLQIACVVLLIVAAINFANFTLAGTPMQIKAINTRKVLGMTNWQLRREYILGTVAESAFAFLISLALIWQLGQIPLVIDLVSGLIAISDNLYLILYIGVAALLIGVLVGVYPAWFATSFPPAMVLKGSFGLSSRGVLLRKVLVCVQLFVAFVMTFYLGVLYLQKDYIFSSDYGFAKDEILYCNQWVKKADFESVRSELEKIPGVESVGFALYMPGVAGPAQIWGMGNEQQNLTVAVRPCDWKFLNTMGIEIVEGRDFSESGKDVFIVNETLRNRHDWIGIDKPIAGDNERVIDVCKNHRVYKMTQDNSEVEAGYLVLGNKYDYWDPAFRVAARVGKNVDKISVKRNLEKTLARISPSEGCEPEFLFMDERLQTTYEKEFRFIRQVEGFSLVCLLITLVGVFCLTIFETQYRRREIALRRVLGSRSADIHRLFLLRYVWLILPAFLLAAPAAWRLSTDWLQNFSDRTPIPLWPTLLTLLTVTLPILLTVALQTHRALRMKPLEAIKAE